MSECPAMLAEFTTSTYVGVITVIVLSTLQHLKSYSSSPLLSPPRHLPVPTFFLHSRLSSSTALELPLPHVLLVQTPVFGQAVRDCAATSVVHGDCILYFHRCNRALQRHLVLLIAAAASVAKAVGASWREDTRTNTQFNHHETRKKAEEEEEESGKTRERIE